MGTLRRKLADRIAAQFALLRARKLLATAPIGALTERRRADHTAAEGMPRPADAARARELADAVRWAARHGLFRPFCLVQSLAIQDLLRSAAIDGGEIRIGVRRDGPSLQAHAWVRWHDEILGDDTSYVSRFTEVDDIGVLGLPG